MAFGGRALQLDLKPYNKNIRAQLTARANFLYSLVNFIIRI